MCRDPKNNVRKHGLIQCRNVVVVVVVVVVVDVDVVQLLFVLFIFNIFFLELLRT